jgi:endonuclease/exonuclease/phosphatase (EEP) superfamily protein YafD
MLSEALNRYQNRTIDAAQVIAEIVEIAKAIQAQRQRGEETGLTENELAFYDALSTNESARLAMQDESLRKIAHELTEIVRTDAKTDWQVKETVRAKLRTRIAAPAQAWLPARPGADRDPADHPAGRGYGGRGGRIALRPCVGSCVAWRRR